MFSVRLGKDIEDQLASREYETGVSKSEIVREAISYYFSVQDTRTPYQLGQHLFGLFDSGDPTLSQQIQSKLSERIKSKKGRKP